MSDGDEWTAPWGYRAWRWCAVLAIALLAGCGGSRDPSGNDVQVSGVGPAGNLSPGATAEFLMTVQNIGHNAAADLRIVDQLGSFLVLNGITCEAGGGAACPVEPSAVMTVPSLPAGGVLTFRITATVNVITSGTISNTMTATAADDVGRINNSATATAAVVVAAVSAGVAQDGEDTAAAGSPARFNVVLSNPPGGTVIGNVALQWTLSAPFALDGITYTCTASGGAECPAAQTPASSMSFNVASLGASRTLSFVFTVPIPAAGRGAIVSRASLTADGDLDSANNEATLTTQAVDARSGDYQVYAGNGRAYVMTIDFDAGRYTMAADSGSEPVRRSFTAADGGYTVGGGTERLRTAEDLIVGAHAFEGKITPYIAARRFASQLGALTGAFNLMTRSVAADGSAAVTRAGTARVSGNVLQVCQDDFEVVQAQSCGVGALKSYVLGIDGDVFTGTDRPGGPPLLKFRLARTAAADVLLGAGAAPEGGGRQQFLVGLAENAGLIDQRGYGPGIDAAGVPQWLSIDLTRTTYLAEGLPPYAGDVAGLFRLDNLSPVGMLQGAPTPTLAGAPIWVMQSFPLIVAVGATLSEVDQANASGLLQIALP